VGFRDTQKIHGTALAAEQFDRACERRYLCHIFSEYLCKKMPEHSAETKKAACWQLVLQIQRGVSGGSFTTASLPI
jgi:hypothetical protein